MDMAKLRAWWSQRQGLDGSMAGATPAEVLRRAGWARSVGGANPYLTLFARAGTSREAADQAVAELEIHELPSARGCTYVLPAADFALALRVGQGFGDEAQLSTAKKFLDVTDAEIERLKDRVLKALSSGAKDPAELRDELGAAVRNLGDAGKKRGLTTTLPIALGLLQSGGQIRRVPVDGRLDGQRYKYTLWAESPLAASELSQEEAYVELARHFFGWTGPAQASHFRWFSGLGVGSTKAALAPLELQDLGDGWLLLPEDRDAWEHFQAPAEPHYSLISGLDSIILLRRDLASLVDFEGETGRRVHQMAGGALGAPDLENSAILDRGRLVGLWDYDPGAGAIVWASFEPADEAREAAVRRTESFIRDELGDARSFSLDSPKSREPRLEFIRSLS
jgi:hypothetical protein